MARRFLRDAAGVAVGQYVARAALLVRGIVAASALGPAGYGGWNALNLILDYGTYAAAGAQQGLELQLPGAVAGGDAPLARSRLRGAWSVSALGIAAFGVVVALLVAGGGRLAATGWTPPLLLLAAVALQIAIQQQATLLRARGRFDAVSLGLGLQALVGGALGVALVWRWGISGLAAGWLAGTLLGFAWLRRAAPDAPFAPGEWRVGIALARAGLPVFGFFLTSLALRSADRVALVRFGAPEALGHYSVGLMAAGLVLYLPESAAAVLYPRIAAAAHGARDRDTTRREVARAHRALAVALPACVGLAVIWAAPVIAGALPAYREGVPAMRLLMLGALALAAATLPGYVLLGSGRAKTLLLAGAIAAAFDAALVYGVARFDPRPTAVALATLAGYAAFAAGLVGLAAPALHERASERVGFVLASFVPAAWAGALALAACALGPPESAASAALRSLAFLAGYAPALWWFARGIGLRTLATDWLAARAAA